MDIIAIAVTNIDKAAICKANIVIMLFSLYKVYLLMYPFIDLSEEGSPFLSQNFGSG